MRIVFFGMLCKQNRQEAVTRTKWLSLIQCLSSIIRLSGFIRTIIFANFVWISNECKVVGCVIWIHYHVFQRVSSLDTGLLFDCACDHNFCLWKLQMENEFGKSKIKRHMVAGYTLGYISRGMGHITRSLQNYSKSYRKSRKEENCRCKKCNILILNLHMREWMNKQLICTIKFTRIKANQAKMWFQRQRVSKLKFCVLVCKVLSSFFDFGSLFMPIEIECNVIENHACMLKLIIDTTWIKSCAAVRKHGHGYFH